MDKDDLTNQEMNLLKIKEPSTNILPLFPKREERSLRIQDALKNLNIDLKKIFEDRPQKHRRYPGVVLPFKKDK